MTLTRPQLNARAAGCKVTREQPQRITDVVYREHRWNCGCIYRFVRNASGAFDHVQSTHCTPWGEKS